MRILFMGTPDFAVPTLKTLINSKHDVLGVVTQPDKPKGRGGRMQFSPVKEAALEENIPVYQPMRVSDEAFLFELRQMYPDVIVVAAFGQILSKEVLELPEYGCINVHASLLPKLRGAAPIQWAVIDGEAESGVTIMQMNEGLDTGDILLMKKYRLKEKETGGSLFEALSVMGGPLVLEVLDQIEEGTLHPVPQKEEEHTYAKMLKKSTGEMDFDKSAFALERLIRGLNPWPSAYTYFNGKMLKIWEASVVSEEELSAEEAGKKPGTVLAVKKDYFLIRAGEGAVKVTDVQLEGKKRMSAEAFLRGASLAADTVFGKEKE